MGTQLLSEARTLAAYLIFLGSYGVFALGKLSWMNIDRPGAAIIGAVLMVAFGIVGAPELAMASTLAGNLMITGSVANIIVVERAAAEGVDVTFREYLRAGVPITLATLAVGSTWLWLLV